MDENFKTALGKFLQGEILYKKIMAFSLLIFGVLTLLAILNVEQVTSFDNYIVTNFNSFALKHDPSLMIFITNFGSVKWVFPVAFIFISVLLTIKRFREALFLFMAVSGAAFLTVVLKMLIGRSRPALNSPLTQAVWYGFPSGHTTIATCFYGTLIYLACIYIKDKWLKILTVTFLTVLILLVGISRVYLGAHFPTDVLGGLSIGVFWTTLCAFIYKKTNNL